MSVKSSLVVGASVVALGVGVLSYTDPMRDTTPAQRQDQQQVEDLVDQQERIDDQKRRDGEAVGEAHYRDSIGYSDELPAEKLPRVHFRILP